MLQSLSNRIRELWGLFFYTNPVESPEAEAWRAYDRARLAGAPGIAMEEVGRLIGAGLQHRIYAYDRAAPSVLKLLVPNRFLRFPTLAEAQQDLALVQRYFAPYAVEPTEVIPLRDGSYAIRQRRLAAFHSISREDLADPIVRQQFTDLLARNAQMRREAGRSLDLLGREGQRKARAALVGMAQRPVISNLVIEAPPDGSQLVRIIDTDLENFRPGAHSLRDLRSAVAAHLALAVNGWLLRHFFDVDLNAPGLANPASSVPAGVSPATLHSQESEPK